MAGRAGTGTGTGIMADQQQGGMGGMLGGVGKSVGGMENKAREEMALNMIMQTLRGLKYPLGKADLAREAQQRHAPGQLTDVIDKMPDRQYTSADDVAEEARKHWQD
jgi:hypothetical protein